MNIRICTPVVGKSLEEFLTCLNKTQEISDFVELRTDYINDFSVKNIEVIAQNVKVPSLFTCRRKDEGGKFNGDEKVRVEILQNALNNNFEYVDIELSTMQGNDFKRSNAKLIISYHNFKETPSYWDMQKIIHDMNKHVPDIIKIATMIQEEHEVTKIYRLLTNKPHAEERIVIGMGEKGKMTRILGPLLGSYLTYASTEWGESAPGQIDIKELIKIYKNMFPEFDSGSMIY